MSETFVAHEHELILGIKSCEMSKNWLNSDFLSAPHRLGQKIWFSASAPRCSIFYNLKIFKILRLIVARLLIKCHNMTSSILKSHGNIFHSLMLISDEEFICKLPRFNGQVVYGKCLAPLPGTGSRHLSIQVFMLVIFARSIIDNRKVCTNTN